MPILWIFLLLAALLESQFPYMITIGPSDVHIHVFCPATI